MLKKLLLRVFSAAVILSGFMVYAATPVAAAGTTSVTINKYDAHGNIVNTTTVTWEQMRDNLPVYGDGVTHYYCEGPNFNETRTFDTLWDPTETGNIDSRDYGAAKGTDVKDLCNLVGGAAPGYTITTKAIDGWNKAWDYENVYDPNPRFGRLVLTWYTIGTVEGSSGYVPDYTKGMRLLFFTDITDASGRHVAGDYDAHESLPENRWYYYFDGQNWPTTSGMSGFTIDRIEIRPPTMVSCDSIGNTKESFAPGETVYVKGQGLTAARSYNLWIQAEPAVLNWAAKGDTVPGATFPGPMNVANDPSGAQEAVTTDASGDFVPTAIWTIPSSTAANVKYDIVADIQGSGTVGTFDNSDAADSPGFQGFTVIPLPPPAAAFTADATSGQAPLTVHFTDQSTNSPTSWAWDFDNNGSTDSTDQNPSYEYAAPGTYTVKLTATNDSGSDDEVKTGYITVSAIPTFTITASAGANGSISPSGAVPVEPGANQTFAITAGTGYHIADVLVDGSSVGAVTSYEFTNIIADHTIAASFAEDVVVVAPVAAFTADATSGVAPLTVYFTDHSENTPTSWAWDFDNSGTTDSTLQNPSFTYTSAGTYTVKLTATNSAGSDDEVKTGYITVTPHTWYIDDDGGADFTTIGAAITAAGAGDTIIVRNGTYNENVAVSKSLTIRSEYRHGATVMTPTSSSNHFALTASNVTIDGFVLTKTASGGVGIYSGSTINLSNCTFVNNLIFNTATGIMIGASTKTASNIVISNNTFCATTAAIQVTNINDSAITNNVCINCLGTGTTNGIYLKKGSQASYTSSGNVISNNTVVSTIYGIQLDYVKNNNIITNNTILNPTTAGIYLYASSAYPVTNNTFFLNSVINAPTNIKIYNSLNSYATGNIWNTTAPLTYWYGGVERSEYMGNYWSNYAGADADGNGIGDTAYITVSPNQDSYPLMAEAMDYVLTLSAPTAEFYSNYTAPQSSPLTVKFYDLSAGIPTGWAWDFDNNGTTDSTAQSPTYTFEAPGTYTVKLTATNANGSDDEVKTSFITVLANNFTITASAGANGSISPSGAVSVESGANRTFAITPSTGYHVADVLVDGGSVGAVTSYEFINVAADHTISASFAIDTFAITATAGENGTITPSGAVSVNYGSDRTFTIVPGTGYRVLDVTVDGVSQGAITSYTFSNVTDNHAISASFIPSWDLNGDHVINIGDVVKIGLVWGQTGTPGWIPEDLNKDGYINIGDVVVVGLHWGETW